MAKLEAASLNLVFRTSIAMRSVSLGQPTWQGAMPVSTRNCPPGPNLPDFGPAVLAADAIVRSGPNLDHLFTNWYPVP